MTPPSTGHGTDPDRPSQADAPMVTAAEEDPNVDDLSSQASSQAGAQAGATSSDDAPAAPSDPSGPAVDRGPTNPA